MPKGKIQRIREKQNCLLILMLIMGINTSLIYYNYSIGKFESNQIILHIQLSHESSLAYGEFVYFYTSAGEDDKFTWEFSGTNSYFGIRVYAMTDTEFSKFHNFETFYAYLLSDGSYYRDYGTFNPPSYDRWYIVFLNIDSVRETTYLTYDVEVIRGNNSLFLQIFIPIMVVIIIGGLIAGVAVYSKKQKEKRESEVISKADTKYKSTEDLSTQIEVDVKYCSQCGNPQKLNTIYCIKCGNKFN